MTRKLKLFTARRYLPEGQRYVPLLYPFWGFLSEGPQSIDFDRFVDYTAIGSSLFSLVPIEEADALLFPCEWRSRCREIVEMEKLAKEYDKPIIIFFNSDSSEEIPVKNAVIYRTSFFASQRKPNEFALPGWSRDFLKSYLQGQIRLRDKKELPVIGYTGYVDYYDTLSYFLNLGRRIKNRGRVHLGARLRGTAARLLSRSHMVRANFLIRRLSGSAIVRYFSLSRNEGFRNEYVRNIVESDYTLVTRGGGNFSYRLYEVLSSGRIPVFINTDCVLPFDHIIDWRDHMIWLEAEDIQGIASKVAEFHARLSNQEFHNLQLNARRLYEEWISPVGFYSNMHRCLPF
jgi:hypothetical protein